MENAIPLSLYNIYSLILTETMKKQFTPEITLFFLATLVVQRSKYLLEGTRPKNCKSCDWSRLQRSFYFGQLPDNPAAIWNIFWFFRMASFELNPVLRHEVNLIWTSRSFLEGANLNLPLNFFLNSFGHSFPWENFALCNRNFFQLVLLHIMFERSYFQKCHS